MSGGLLFGKTGQHHRGADLVGIANARGSRTKDDHTLVPNISVRDAQSSVDGRQGDRASALHIIIKGADLVAILLQDASSVAWPKILPVQQGVGKQLRGGFDIGIDKSVVALPT